MKYIHVVVYLCRLKYGGWWHQRRGRIGNEERRDDELGRGRATCEVPFRRPVELSNLQVVIETLSMDKKKEKEKNGLGLALGVFQHFNR